MAKAHKRSINHFRTQKIVRCRMSLLWIFVLPAISDLTAWKHIRKTHYVLAVQPSSMVKRDIADAKLHKANGVDQCWVVTGVRVIDVQSDDGSVSHDVNNSAPILPFWIAVVIDTPGGILEGVVHKDLHKTVRLIPWQMKVMQQVYKHLWGQHRTTSRIQAMLCRFCHAMPWDVSRFRMVCSWCQPCFKKNKTATSRNS